MKTLKHLLFLFFLNFLLSSCQSNESAKPAHFRAITMIHYPSAELIIRGKGKQKDKQQNLTLAYGEPTGYYTFPPGHYEITINVKGKPLLTGSYVLGKSGYYTLLATGLLPENWKVNPRTTMYQLKYIFAGEELESTNKYLPQWFMMRDNYDGSKKSAYLRLVNTNPYTPKVKVKKENQTLKRGLGYPMESKMLKLKPGKHRLHILYGKITLGEKMINTKPGYIYTAIIGNNKNDDNRLILPVLENPSRTLLESK